MQIRLSLKTYRLLNRYVRLNIQTLKKNENVYFQLMKDPNMKNYLIENLNIGNVVYLLSNKDQRMIIERIDKERNGSRPKLGSR